MTIFFTPSVAHLKKDIPGIHGDYKLRRFNDGELFLKLETPAENQKVAVITATNAPAKHMIELFLLLDVLQQHNAQIHLIFTYFGYERQDHPKPNVARAAQVISNCLKQFTFKKVTIVHPHSNLLHNYIDFTPYMPCPLYEDVIQNKKIDIIVSPDQGAIEVCRTIAMKSSCELGSIKKKRNGIDRVNIVSVDADVTDKRVLLLDDMISTGGTIIQAADLLHKQGAREIFAAATHSFINHTTLQKITESPIKHVWVTNTLPVSISATNLSVINIAPAMTTLIRNEKF